jgi:hypothetical protein
MLCSPCGSFSSAAEIKNALGKAGWVRQLGFPDPSGAQVITKAKADLPTNKKDNQKARLIAAIMNFIISTSLGQSDSSSAMMAYEYCASNRGCSTAAHTNPAPTAASLIAMT